MSLEFIIRPCVASHTVRARKVDPRSEPCAYARAHAGLAFRYAPLE